MPDPSPIPKTIFCALLIVAALIVPAASAETVTLVFQDIGLSTQQVDVFDAGGTHLLTTNTSSVIALNVSESNRYTLQLKPQVTNLESADLLATLIAWLTDHSLIVVLLIVLLATVCIILRGH
ncbi:hypothetical protein RJ40_02365 [Methanofollis aquaemaris]|uniref:Uncharacterized protein n=1 Tax=Methanofollis aquaemaris TaxID=126734 RepID=A0A8A3S3U4_9EURY|nr:hypothetical protein [Methanofollis aquaemaris]QSZ66421.1 hypothetical protein RJ40_02365 [Methanofollis aquaemaris]